MSQSLVHDLLIILCAGLVAGLVCRWLRASVLVGYLVVGAIVGKGVLNLISDSEHQLEQFAEVGVFFLLFSIGLEFSIDDLKRLGTKLVIGGTVQMTLVGLPVAYVLAQMQMSWQTSVLIGAAVAFSSTVLVFRALSECGQSEQSHGQRAIGILLFQDAALVPLLLLVPLLMGGDNEVSFTQYSILAITSIVFVVVVIGLRKILARWVIPLFAGYRSPDLIILFTIVSLGGVTLAAFSVGLPPAVGSFAAGLIFNGNRWTKQIDALVLPFRETFAAVFFVGLGLIFDPRLFLSAPLEMIFGLVGVIVIKTIAATIALKLTGLSFKRAFGMGLGLAHIGEFAFVLVLLGLESGVVDELAYQRVVAIAVGSLVLTPPLMRLGLRWAGSDEHTDSAEPQRLGRETTSKRAVVIGAGPIGRRIASQLETSGHDVCLVDLSPINLHLFAQEGFRTVAGDATDRQILMAADVSECGITVVCLPHDATAVRVVRSVRKLNRDGNLVVRCRYQSSAKKMQSLGVDCVVSEEAEASIALTRAITSLEANRSTT
ncbi:Inner membrane protein YbaL [Rubripirellula tenax]|uniref:Inner membrane protein YbaL n=1 Tax=Rubripirellula tenax TaxID=2528015 RepID=A0A5C6F9G4_9BACT|nr:cation:proton antiporter [Rubripirellula tenax]TWU56786.1 Inner membrane protein YbaL [Rubripirellula tenax]